MDMGSTKKLPSDVCLVRWSKEDNCYVAHSMQTDQVGTGDCIVHALADLMRAVRDLLDLAAHDPSIQVLKPAPAEFQRMVKHAKMLPREVYEIAHKMVHGKWPPDLTPNFFATDKPFKAELEDPALA
jgi:hypothetical protein